MVRFIGSLVVFWCAGAVFCAGAQDATPEAACLATLRKVASRLESIETGLTGATQACNAARDSAVAAAIAAKDAELTQLRSSNSKMASEAQAHEGELAALKAAMARVTTQIDLLAVSSVREVLAGPFAACEARPEVTASGGVVRVTGRLLKADDARRRIADAIRSIPGATVQTDGLLKIDVCGQPIGNGWVVEGADDGLRRYGFDQIPSDSFGRMPDGSAETCASIGGSLERINTKDAAHSAFWVKRFQEPSLLAYCAPPSDGGAWTYSTTGLNQVRGLLVQRSQ